MFLSPPGSPTRDPTLAVPLLASTPENAGGDADRRPPATPARDPTAAAAAVQSPEGHQKSGARNGQVSTPPRRRPLPQVGPQAYLFTPKKRKLLPETDFDRQTEVELSQIMKRPCRTCYLREQPHYPYLPRDPHHFVSFRLGFSCPE
ncbi:ORF4 [Simian torque teno virus 34]|uniref:ORF4 n=1 Tax=Simian torque teno virus 34 TaxID=1629657 RepID=A0A0C5IC57_9VIRU|nr:ORF4 [Simian torque teno virus 34]AJP36581.1 ORF4 [Simian torque teno virus 34]